MSSKTKIVVLRMKELIYTGIFVALGIILILLLVFMFAPKDSKPASTDTSDKYVPGVYTSSIMLNGNAVDIAVTVDKDAIASIQMVNVSETVTTMYPLMEPALDNLAEQIIASQSLDHITYPEENQYTSLVILDAVERALEKAGVPEDETEVRKESEDTNGKKSEGSSKVVEE